MVNVLRFRLFTGVFTFLWMAAALTLAFYKYQEKGSVFSYSIDFEGGTQIQLHCDKAIPAAEVQRVLFAVFQKDVIVRSVEGSDLIIRVQEVLDTNAIAERIMSTLEKQFPDTVITLVQSESVGPGVGKTLWQNSLMAIFLSMIVILLYIALRFWSFSFSSAAVLALLHDALSILALILFLDKSISVSVIGAIVAILGYSINDTIVIFSQIREYIEQFKGQSLYDIINRAISKTFRRTLLTSFSTLIPLSIMYFFGGEALNDFSLILITGIVFGTFSSIFVASPLLLLFSQYKNVKVT
jgi:preprotein translocase SecF subunit